MVAPLQRLPRGPHQLAREIVAQSQRGRILGAMADAVAAKGYGAVNVADVVAGAGVSRKTFYVHFRDKLDCFLAAYDVGVEVLLDTIRRAADGLDDPLERTGARIRAYLETLAAEPAFARTFLIEVAAAGSEALARRSAVHEQFAQLAAELGEAAGRPPVPRELHLAAIGATNELVTGWVSEGRTAELAQLEPILVRIHAALLLGEVPA